MSYPGSQQFGLSDLQLLQQQLMLARLQEHQRQQQAGQFGDGKPSSPLNNLSVFVKHAARGQIPNLGGTLFNSSRMVSSSNHNRVHHNVSSSIPGITQGSTYPPDEGLMMNPALQQSDFSLYGAPVGTGKGNLGQYSPMQGAPYCSVGLLTVNSDEKPVSQIPAVANSFGDKHSVPLGHVYSLDGSFMPRQGLQYEDSVGQASVQMLNSGMSAQISPQMISLPKINLPPEYNRTNDQSGRTRSLEEQMRQTNDSRSTATLDPLEEKILYDTDSGWDTSFSKLAALGTAEFVDGLGCKEYMNSFPSTQSGSWSALMQSAVAEASSSDTGIQEELSGLSFQNTDSSIGKQASNIGSKEKHYGKWTDSKLQSTPVSSDDCLKPQHPSRRPEYQQLIHGPVPDKHPMNDSFGRNDKNIADLSQGSRTSALSLSGMIRNDYEFNQKAVDNHSYMPINDDNVQEDYKSMGCDHQSSSNPMAVDMLYKRAAEIYGNQSHYRGENSCDSYNSKIPQAFVAQVGHASLNAEDSESSARSSLKSHNQALCISSPGASSQQECFSHLKSSNAFFINANSMIKGKLNLSADAFSKSSPASDVSASFDSKYTPENDRESQLRDHGSAVQIGFNVSQTKSQDLNMQDISVSQGLVTADKFSFQSYAPEDSRFVSLGNGEKGKTWWTPASIGNSFPPLQGDSPSQSCSGKSNIYGKTAIETSNSKSERNSFEGLISSPWHVNNQLDGKNISKVSETYPETSQQMSSGFSPADNGCPSKNSRSFDHEYTALTGLSVSQAAIVQDLSSLVGLPSRSSSVGEDSCDEPKGPIMEMVSLVKSHDPAKNYLKVSTNALAYAGCSTNQQNYVNSGLVHRSSSATTSSKTCSQPQLLHNSENVKSQQGIANADKNIEDYNSVALSNLNNMQTLDIPGQQPQHEMHNSGKIPVGSQFDLCSSGFSSSSMVQTPSPPSALHHVYSHKVPVFARCYSSVNNVLPDGIRHLLIRAQTGPAGCFQNDYLNNRQMLSHCDSEALDSIKPYENWQKSGTKTHFKGTVVGKNYEILPDLDNPIVTGEQSVPSSILPADSNVNLVLNRTKKRKTAMYNCLPWRKEVIKTHQGLPDVSNSEEEWAEATNRLIEKCVDEGERTVELQPTVRAKRRLILTTELMQLIFRAPPPIVLSVDASVEYEIVTYFITKLALADACSLTTKTRIDCNMPHETGNMDRNGRMANWLCDRATELHQRTKELENHIERLSKGVSVVDVLVECQELEKLCVINHFAKYHSRVQGSVATDSASSTSLASVRPFLQRYVSAVPLPLKLPDGVQCLSL